MPVTVLEDPHMPRVALALILTLLAGSVLVAASAQAPGGDAQAAALLAKHRAYVGWQFGDGTFRSMRITGDVTNEKGERTISFVSLSRGLLVRDIYTMIAHGNVSENTGFTGSVFWSSDYNGFTTPIYGGYAKYLASSAVLGLEGTTELPATYRGEATVAGKPLAIVRVTLKNADAMDLYEDPATGAYVQAVIDPGGPYEKTLHIVAYAEAMPGKKMISAYRIGKDTALHTYRIFEPNAAVSDADLHPPSATASWTFGDPKPAPISLHKNRIIIGATVNGIKGRFILDTGATAIVLDDQFAERAGAAAVGGPGEASTFYGTVRTKTRRVGTIVVGGSTLHNVFVDSEDFRAHDYRGLDREGYDGLMGYDLFAGAIVKLNVYNSTLTLLDPSTELSDASGVAFRVDLSRHIPAIPMTVNASVPVETILDTGNPGVAFLSYDLARKHDLRLGSPVCGNIQTLQVGPITYSGQSVCLDNFGGDMLVGYDFLKHFDYVFDYPHGRLFLAPNKN
jgi:hypothetical protein